MVRNWIWIIFLVLVAAFTLWFIIKAGSAATHYFQLKTQVPATIEKWEVEEIRAERFAVVAHYSFEFQDKIYRGKGQAGELYPNPWAAGKAQKQFAEKRWSVWLNPKHPEKAFLEKRFPYRKTISAGVLAGLSLYFFILGTYVKARHGR
jgi:hypothetical protein